MQIQDRIVIQLRIAIATVVPTIAGNILEVEVKHTVAHIRLIDMRLEARKILKYWKCWVKVIYLLVNTCEELS